MRYLQTVKTNESVGLNLDDGLRWRAGLWTKRDCFGPEYLLPAISRFTSRLGLLVRDRTLLLPPWRCRQWCSARAVALGVLARVTGWFAAIQSRRLAV